jgi:hypothetical protein
MASPLAGYQKRTEGGPRGGWVEWIASRSSSAVKRRATNAAPSHRGEICVRSEIHYNSLLHRLAGPLLILKSSCTRTRVSQTQWRLLSPFS